MADSKKYNGSTWEHSLRKLTTATDTITTLPVNIYADGNNATVSISGNTVQSGTPTPDNPIMPEGTGERAENLFDYNDLENGTLNNGEPRPYTGHKRTANFITVESSTTYIISNLNVSERVSYYDSTKAFLFNELISGVFTTPANCKYIKFSGIATGWTQTTMLNLGSTALPYEPYGYKIPISSADITTSIYLGEVQTTRKIRKLVFDGTESITLGTNNQFLYISNTIKGTMIPLISSHYKPYDNDVSDKTVRQFASTLVAAPVISIRDTSYSNAEDFKTYLQQQYAAGTPVTVWYVLATETTGIVNEPLMKIDDYADMVSGITIPTITGKDTVDVKTTIKPSEVSVNYHGWHPVQSVHEKSKNLFDIENTVGFVSDITDWSQTIGDNAIIVDATTISGVARGLVMSMGVFPAGTYTFSCALSPLRDIVLRVKGGTNNSKTVTITEESELEIYVIVLKDTYTFSDIMLNTGSTALPYEPYWT